MIIYSISKNLKRIRRDPKKNLKLLSYISIISLVSLAFGKTFGISLQSDQRRLTPTQFVQDEFFLTKFEDIKPVSENEFPYISETTIQPGDTISDVLDRLEIHEPGLLNFLACNSNARSIHKLYPGRPVQVASNSSGKLLWLRYIYTHNNQINGQLVAKQLYVFPYEKTYKAREQTQQIDCETHYGMGTAYSSLFNATDSAGIPDSITIQMADILSTKIDFIKDLRRGDQFRVIYEAYYHEGRYLGSGRVLALEFINDNKVYTAIWFSPDGKNGSYYDFEGSSLCSSFLRTALKFSRISSTFGKRVHPIHKTWTDHKGVDYAAPSGTPIYATADGVVEFSGWKNGYGNVVILSHFEKYSTLYAHQSKIEPGIKKNAKILQGQLLGYVGSTGNATGPHLHYELRIDNCPVDPLSVNLPTIQKLEPSQLKAFKKISTLYYEKMELLREFQKEESRLLASR